MAIFFKPYFVDQTGYYRDKCGGCINYNITNLRDAYNDGYPCVARRNKRLAFDDSCTSQREDRRRTDKDIKKAFEAMEAKYGRYKPHSYSAWHIMTAVCNILGIDEYQEYLATGVYFREEVLQKDLRYLGLLVQYDMLGRLVANSLWQDEQKEVVAYELFVNYLKPFCENVQNNNVDAALGRYTEMYERLKEIYQITDVTTYDFDHTHQMSTDEIQSLGRTVHKS